MPLRTLNNPRDIVTVMGILKNILAVDLHTGQPNTLLGQMQQADSSDRIYIQQVFEISQGPMPAVLILAGQQRYRLAALEGRDGTQQISIRYFDSWTEQPATMDAIKANNTADLMRMAANIEDNDALTFKGANYGMSVFEIMLSGYDGVIDNVTVPGKTYIRHDLNLVINILPYGVGGV